MQACLAMMERVVSKNILLATFVKKLSLNYLKGKYLL